MTLPEWISPGEAARRLGVSRQALARKLPAMAENGTARRVGERWRVRIEGLEQAYDDVTRRKADSPRLAPPQTAMEDPAPADGSDLRPIAESRQHREHWEAETARLKAEQLAGRLVAVADIEAALFAHIRGARDALLGIPLRTVDVIAGIVGTMTAEQRDKVEQAMTGEIRKVLEDLARMPSAVTTENGDGI